MAGLETSGSNPDVSLLHDINGLAKGAPGWVDHTVEFLGAYGLLLGMMLLLLVCWWTGRRCAESLDAAASSAAAVIWAPLAAAIAVLVNVPIRSFVKRPRPFAAHEGLDVLVHGKNDYSFVSDHATLAMAMAAGLFVVSRKFGLIGMVMALAEGFCRVFVGVHYPTDVIGGFALGAAVALLLSPLATAALTPLTKTVGRSVCAGWLIRPPQYPAVPADLAAEQDSDGQEVHERRQEQCSEPTTARGGTRVREHGAPAAPVAEERPGRRTRQPRESRSAPQDRDGPGRHGADVTATGPGSKAPGRTGDGKAAGRPGADVPERPGGPRQPGGRQEPADPSGPRDPQGPGEPDLAA
jgi:undecaprenyl-diphosphatase